MNTSPRADRRHSVGRRITDRQAAILDLVSAGHGNKAIAHELGISEQAVKEHVSALLRRLDAPNRAALGEIAATRRLVGSDVNPAWLGLLFRAAPLIIGFVSSDLDVLAANEAACRAVGQDPVGRNVRDLAPDLGATEIVRELERVVATGEPRTVHGLAGRSRRGRDEREHGHVTVLLEPIRVGGETDVSGVAIYAIDLREIANGHVLRTHEANAPKNVPDA